MEAQLAGLFSFFFFFFVDIAGSLFLSFRSLLSSPSFFSISSFLLFFFLFRHAAGGSSLSVYACVRRVRMACRVCGWCERVRGLELDLACWHAGIKSSCHGPALTLLPSFTFPPSLPPSLPPPSLPPSLPLFAHPPLPTCHFDLSPQRSRLSRLWQQVQRQHPPPPQVRHRCPRLRPAFSLSLSLSLSLSPLSPPPPPPPPPPNFSCTPVSRCSATRCRT